ncbi:alkylmercury lyase family protein [Nocardioides sp. NPDC057767]|uniref:alkylmercury lyase family protein n=1 Tax=unclassified Nocardioides TaxID=2615069 RepID=UPI0033240D79
MTTANPPSGTGGVRIEVLHVPDCPNLAPMLNRLHQVTDIPVSTREVRTDAEAAAFGMAGSPTLLINGDDPFADPDACECGIACRLYRDENDQIVSAPSAEQIRAALTKVHQPAPALPEEPDRYGTGTRSPAGVLSAWRTEAVPMNPLERAVHQAILHTFATTGEPPSFEDLLHESAASRPVLHGVLGRLHDTDAIRLDSRGAVAVAYPFSARPTRHRVRIGDGVTVHAMCGIDALGISAMLHEDVRIDTTDPVTGDPITVTSTAGRTTWNPPGAVAFVGADAGGGPSADCCCDYINLFTSSATAQAWAAAHPRVPGQVLTKIEAEELATSLFGALHARPMPR